jgi:carboxyl-terminal processing protease
MRSSCALVLCALLLSPQEQVSKFEAAREAIEKNFIRPIDGAEIEDRALRLLLKNLDPYSQYLDADEWKLFRSGFQPSFAGIGVTLRIDPEAKVPRFTYLTIGSAAGKAGARRGDSLVSIDGRSLEGVPMDTILTWLRGAPDTPVEITLRRDGKLIPLTIIRQLVTTPTVRGARRDAEGRDDYLLDREQRIGYIRILRLGDDTAREVESALDALQREKATALVLDLRDRAGGKMSAAVAIADLFLDRGRIVTLVSREGEEIHDATPGTKTTVPIAMLINDGTASSSEVLAGALIDHDRVVALGQRTYGKGRIQVMFPLAEGMGGLVLSTGTFQRPSGKTIDKHETAAGAEAGVAPHIEIALPIDERKAWDDDMSRLDGRFELTAEEQRPRTPDRVLEAALKALIHR